MRAYLEGVVNVSETQPALALSLSLAAMPLSRRAAGLREGEAARAKEERDSGERDGRAARNPAEKR